MTTNEPGRAAYEAYFEGEIGSRKTYGLWEELPEHARAIWRRVEEAVLRNAAVDIRERAARACEAAAEAADQLSVTTKQNGVPDLAFAWGCAAEACRNRAAAIRVLPIRPEDEALGVEPIAFLPNLRLPGA